MKGLLTTGDHFESDNDLKLLRGRVGEANIAAKADALTNFLLLTAFLLAFSLQRIMDVEPDDFSSHNTLHYEWHFTLMCVSSAAGFCSVLVSTFFAIRVRRLRAKSTLIFGDSDFAINWDSSVI